ncbi:hypothetical protein [Parabacteroides sp.]
MKKILTILCGILLTAGVAFAQKPYTGDWVIKSNGKLLYTIYDNGKNLRMDVVNEETGEMKPMIVFGKDSLCIIMEESRSYGVFTGEALRKKKKELLGLEIESISNSKEYEFVKKEFISGLECSMYHYTQKETHYETVGGQTSVKEGSQQYDVWFSPEIRHSVQREDPNYVRIETMTNIKFGMPHASLFVVPKGYKRISMDAMMVVFTI